MVITQNNCCHRKLLGNEQWGAVDVIKHCEKRLPLKLPGFWERSNFSLKYFNWFQDLSWGLEFKHLLKHTTCATRVFSFHYSLATSTTNWAQMFTGLLFYAYVEIHQVRRLVLDNYQRCPVPLKHIEILVWPWICIIFVLVKGKPSPSEAKRVAVPIEWW